MVGVSDWRQHAVPNGRVRIVSIRVRRVVHFLPEPLRRATSATRSAHAHVRTHACEWLRRSLPRQCRSARVRAHHVAECK